MVDHRQSTSGAGDLLFALVRRWWVIAAALLAALVIGFLLTPEPGYSATFRATVLIPGDTEDPGASERPELMVLDDLGPFVESWAFAEAVAAELGGDLATDDIHGMLDGSRYSRVATVTVTGDDADLVARVAGAAAAVFPDQVNAYLVAPGDAEATVQVIDPPREPVRDQAMRWVRVGAIGLLGAASASAVVAMLAPDRRERQPA
jgi:uncharacterized protein involved in exopolysaccharide biosynthesis